MYETGELQQVLGLDTAAQQPETPAEPQPAEAPPLSIENRLS
jgi:hypothetical protein